MNTKNIDNLCYTFLDMLKDFIVYTNAKNVIRKKCACHLIMHKNNFL